MARSYPMGFNSVLARIRSLGSINSMARMTILGFNKLMAVWLALLSWISMSGLARSLALGFIVSSARIGSVGFTAAAASQNFLWVSLMSWLRKIGMDFIGVVARIGALDFHIDLG